MPEPGFEILNLFTVAACAFREQNQGIPGIENTLHHIQRILRRRGLLLFILCCRLDFFTACNQHRTKNTFGNITTEPGFIPVILRRHRVNAFSRRTGQAGPNHQSVKVTGVVGVINTGFAFRQRGVLLCTDAGQKPAYRHQQRRDNFLIRRKRFTGHPLLSLRKSVISMRVRRTVVQSAPRVITHSMIRNSH